VALLLANIDTDFGIDTRQRPASRRPFFGAKAGFTPAVLFRECRGERASVAFFGGREKISRCMQLFVTIRYYGSGRLVGQRTCVLLR
jgi:hypothetical protein